MWDLVQCLVSALQFHDGSSEVSRGKSFAGVQRLWMGDPRITPLKTTNYLPGAKLDYHLPWHRHQELSKHEIPVGWSEHCGLPKGGDRKQSSDGWE